MHARDFHVICTTSRVTSWSEMAKVMTICPYKDIAQGNVLHTNIGLRYYYSSFVFMYGMIEKSKHYLTSL